MNPDQKRDLGRLTGLSEKPDDDDLAQWESQFSQLMNSQRDELDDYGQIMQEAYENDVRGIESESRFDEDGIPRLEPYVFGNLISYVENSRI